MAHPHPVSGLGRRQSKQEVTRKSTGYRHAGRRVSGGGGASKQSQGPAGDGLIRIASEGLRQGALSPHGVVLSRQKKWVKGE